MRTTTAFRACIGPETTDPAACADQIGRAPDLEHVSFTSNLGKGVPRGGPAVQLSDIDLTDMDRFQAEFPHEWFTFLRREAPVWFHPPTATEGNERGFWVVTKYEDVIAVSRDWQTFSSEKAPESDTGGIMLPDIGPEAGVGTMMLMMDPPQHTRYRKLVSSAFTPRVIKLFEEQVRRRSREIVDRVMLRGECDFVTDVAAQ